MLDALGEMRDIGDRMSNFDHSIDPGTEDELRAGGCFCGYPAWNFYGRVWFEDGKFHCRVAQYGTHVATISENSLTDLMSECSDQFGGD